MKEAIIDAAGKTWQYLGKNGETEVKTLAKRIKVKNDIVNQSLGWLAREDKIMCVNRDNKTFVSLSEDEQLVFSGLMQSNN